MNFQLTGQIAAYPFTGFQDDDDIQAFFMATNAQNQQYVDFFNEYNMAVYTADNISGSLLDWIAGGVYGMTRPIFPLTAATIVGPYNTAIYNTIAYDYGKSSGSATFYYVNDDIFKRCITWNFYKGDGKQINVEWLKRRTLRWLLGANGSDVNIDQTYGVSITFPTATSVDINIENSSSYGVIANAFQSAINAQVLQTPTQLTFGVNLL